MNEQTLKDIDRAFKALEALDEISAEIDEQIKYNTYFNSDMAKGEIIAFEWVKRKIDEYTKGEGE
jgi:hypothetical protein